MPNELRDRACRLLMPACRTLGVVALSLGVASEAGAQGLVTGVDPMAVQAGIAANPDFDVASLWRSVKVPAELDTVYAKVGAPAASASAVFDRCANACRAEIARANVDDDSSVETVLVVYQESRFCRLLVFKESLTPAGVTQWRFVGHADHDALGQYEPEYRAAVMGGRRYLVLSAPGTQSAGRRLTYERWYEVTPGGMREVLTVAADGLECQDARSLCRAFGSTVVASRNGPRGEELSVSFTVRYWGDAFLLDESRAAEIPLFGRVQKAVFLRPLKSTQRYELAPLDSDVGSWELEAIFGASALTCQQFLLSNQDDLMRIASDRGAAARSWLARYLDGCAPSEQRTEFLALLAK